ASANQGERLTMSTERLNQSTDRIKESRCAALEMEELEVSILEDMQQQRETLLHSHKKACVTPWLRVLNNITSVFR
ncbi:vesicle transport v-SNARE 12-like, partial [Olea europaea subsp. europaea]